MVVAAFALASSACVVDEPHPPADVDAAPLGGLPLGTKPVDTLVEHQMRSVPDDPRAVRGDFNGDGQPEYAVGDPTWDAGSINHAGRVLVFETTGCGDTAAPTPSRVFRPGIGGLPGSALSSGRFGFSIVVGNFDGDAYDDLAIGMPGRTGPNQTFGGKVYVLFGSAKGLSSTGALSFDQDDFAYAWNGPPTQGHDQMTGGETFGYALAAGDLDADGRDDLAIGAPYDDRYSHSRAGVVHVVYGSTAGLALPAGVQSFDRSWSPLGSSVHSGDRFGFQLTIGHFRFAKARSLVVSAPGADDAGTNTGSIHVLRGAKSGLGPGGAALFNENAPGFASTPQVGEAFGHRLHLHNEGGDVLDDLVVETLNSPDCNGPGRHLMQGTSSGIASTGGYACGEMAAPRFDLAVAPPSPPIGISYPATPVVVDNAKSLVEHLTNGVAEVILVEDGLYDWAAPVVVDAPDVVWARHTGAARLRFGLHIRFYDASWASNQPVVLQGLTFEAVNGAASFPVVAGTDTAAVLMTPINLVSGLGGFGSLEVHDCFIYGQGELAYGIRALRPHHLTVERVRVRDVQSIGVYIRGPVASPLDPTPNDVDVNIHDLDVAGVFRPDGVGGVPDPKHDNGLYWCKEEAGLLVTDLEDANIERVRIRDTRCAGINLAINRWEQSSPTGHVRDLDVDCAGYFPPLLTWDGQMRPVRNAGIYLQDSSSISLQRLWVGPETYDGLRSEHPDPNSTLPLTANEFVSIEDGLFQAARMGISLDGCTSGFDLSYYTIERAACAGVYDPAGSCPNAAPNTGNNATYHLAPSVPIWRTDSILNCTATF